MTGAHQFDRLLIMIIPLIFYYHYYFLKFLVQFLSLLSVAA